MKGKGGHDFRKSGKEATIENLIAWMMTETKTKMRATATLESIGNVKVEFSENSPKCWACNYHFVDQCRKFFSMSPKEPSRERQSNML